MASHETVKDENTSQEAQELSNKPMINEQLPSIEHLIYQPLAPIYLKMRRRFNLFSTATILLILFLCQKQQFFPLPSQALNTISYLILAIGLIGILRYLYIVIADKKKYFALREQDITYRCGVIFQKTVTQPILRIQHVELKRGPLERKFGLACLQLFSAGGAAHTFEIPGLLLEDAESMRQFILDHKTISNT
ncbi:MAG: PH domain-containing protein [Colwellia sp.]|nr:PH domain-containing protein [Colwellia sp.]